MRAAHLVFNIFMTILINGILMVAFWLALYTYDAFVTMDNIEDVVTQMKYELSVCNGFSPEHMTMASGYPKIDKDNKTWTYNLNDPYAESDYKDYNINVGTTTKAQVADIDTTYTKNIYQALLKQAIASSNVFSNATVVSVQGQGTGKYARCNMQYHVAKSASGDIIDTTPNNMDKSNTTEEAYVVGNRGDWITLTVKLHTTRNSIMTFGYSNITGELEVLNDVNAEKGGKDIILTYKVPCLSYKVGKYKPM